MMNKFPNDFPKKPTPTAPEIPAYPAEYAEYESQRNTYNIKSTSSNNMKEFFDTVVDTNYKAMGAFITDIKTKVSQNSKGNLVINLNASCSAPQTIAYNKELVLANPGVGLDFTLDSPHEVVPIVSGTANYHTSDWMCWRTAFREVIKLKASLPDVVNEYRLNIWLTSDRTPEQWSRKGAEDAVEFYDTVNGDPTELKKSYEWDWLASYAFMKRSLVSK
jgi:hypothetical protein